MHDIIDHSDFQNSFKVLMTFITTYESESSPSPACLESSSSLNMWDSSPSLTRSELESDSSLWTRVPISGIHSK